MSFLLKRSHFFVRNSETCIKVVGNCANRDKNLMETTEKLTFFNFIFSKLLNFCCKYQRNQIQSDWEDKQEHILSF